MELVYQLSSLAIMFGLLHLYVRHYANRVSQAEAVSGFHDWLLDVGAKVAEKSQAELALHPDTMSEEELEAWDDAFAFGLSPQEAADAYIEGMIGNTISKAVA